VFNACAPSNITFLIGFALFLLFKDRTIIHTAILPMFFFGVGGLIVFPWSGMNILPQIGHMIMALNIGWTIFATLKTADYKAATVGLLLGIAVFSFFIAFQQNYAAAHPVDFKRIMQME
jgi:tryptophan-rich sensory protein